MAKRSLPLRPTGQPHWDLDNCEVNTHGFRNSRKQDYNRHLKELQAIYEHYIAKDSWQKITADERNVFKSYLVKEIGLWSHTLKVEWRTAILNFFLEADLDYDGAIMAGKLLRFTLEAVNIHMGSVEAAAGLEKLFQNLRGLLLGESFEPVTTAIKSPIKIPESLHDVPNSARRQEAAAMIFNEFEKLQKIMSVKGKGLFAKWKNMNRDERAKLLKRAWSDISDNSHEALRAVMQGDFQSATEQAYKWPDFNIENLAFQGNLFLHLYTRVVMDPHSFVHCDHQSWRLGREFGQVPIPWCAGVMMAFMTVGVEDIAETVRTYGGLLLDVQFPENVWVMLKGIDATLTLEIQAQIYTFLNSVCRELAGDELEGDASAAFNPPDTVPAEESSWMTKLVNISNATIDKQAISNRNAATSSPRVTVDLGLYINDIIMRANNKENEGSTSMRFDPLNFGHKLRLYLESYRRIQRVFGKSSSKGYEMAGLSVFLKSELRALCTTHFIRISFGDVFNCVKAANSHAGEDIGQERVDDLLIRYLALLKGISHYIEIESKPVAETMLGFSDSVVDSIHWKDHDIAAPKGKKSQKKSGHYTTKPDNDNSLPIDILLSLRDILEDGDNSNHIRKHALGVIGQGKAFEFLKWHSYMNKDSLGWSTAQCEHSKLKVIEEISYIQEAISNWYPRCDPVIGDSVFGLEEPVAAIVDKFRASLNALDTFVNKHISRLWENAALLLDEIDTLEKHWEGYPMPDSSKNLVSLAKTTTGTDKDALHSQLHRACIRLTEFWDYFRKILVEENLVPGPEENQDDPSDILPTAIQSALLSAPWTLEYQPDSELGHVRVTRPKPEDQDAGYYHQTKDKDKGKGKGKGKSKKSIFRLASGDGHVSVSSSTSSTPSNERLDTDDEAHEAEGSIKGKETALGQASGDEDKGKETSPGKRPREEIEEERSEEPPSKKTKSGKIKTRGVADPSKDTKRKRYASDKTQETPYIPTRLPVSNQSHRLLTMMYGDPAQKLNAGKKADFSDLVQTLSDLGFGLMRVKSNMNHFKAPKRWEEHGSITFHRPHPDHKLDQSVVKNWIDRLGKYPIEEEFKEGLFDPAE